MELMNQTIMSLTKEMDCKKSLYTDEICELKRRLLTCKYDVDDAVKLDDKVRSLLYSIV